MMNLVSLGIAAVEQGIVPDWLTRLAIRRLCRQRLLEVEEHRSSTARAEFLASLRHGPIAPVPEKANEQHYELPADFFTMLLGPRLKYSCCYWPDRGGTLAAAEAAALERTCERADLQDGQDILELGCGWGSLSLWMAERYPASRILAVSNSAPQRNFIESAAAARQLLNLRVVTADMNFFSPPAAAPGSFDRVVSVEMFEHMRNLELLLARIATWLRPDGKLFVHYFCHRQSSYPFETDGTADWMGKYFFTGGMMPNADMLRAHDRHLRVTNEWNWDGRHYQRTALAWLENLDRHHGRAIDILNKVYGSQEAHRWLQRWRVFLLAVAELFGYNAGQEWFVAHRLLQPVSIPIREVRPCLSSS